MSSSTLCYQVQPGNRTGVYYILLCGLPWGFAWQTLKDVCRNLRPGELPIQIDYVFIYPEETNGWVRVRGRENFCRMMERLESLVMDRRCLVVDGRNETEITTIKVPRTFLDLGNHGWGQRQPSWGGTPMSRTIPGSAILPLRGDRFQPPALPNVLYASNVALMTPVSPILHVFGMPIVQAPNPQAFGFQGPVLPYTPRAPSPDIPRTPPPTPVRTTKAGEVIIADLPCSMCGKAMPSEPKRNVEESVVSPIVVDGSSAGNSGKL